jgi:ADP-heptose:LPS heptosyltransferase
MTPAPFERLRLEIRPPRDRMVPDRLRRAARRLYLAARAPVLLSLRLVRWRRPRPPRPDEVKRLLVVRADRLGDMALTTAALMDLRAHFRRAEITVLAPPGPIELLQGHPAVDQRVALGPEGLPRELVGRFDLAIDFTPDEALRGALLVARSRAPYRAGFTASGRQALFNLKGPRARGGRHVVDLNRDLVAALGAPAETPRPVLHVTARERGAAQARLAGLGAASPRVAIHPGGHYSSQRWAPERFGELIAALTVRTGAACVVLHGPGEETLARRIAAATPDALIVPAISVRDLMALLACCDLFVGNNSGPLHVAAALGLPTVSVAGPTDLERFTPRGAADRVLRRPLPCSPCQRARCWHHTCLRAIEPEEVLEEAAAALRAVLPLREAR